MYRKIYRLRTQVESGNIDVDKVKTLLWSIFEQAEAVGNKDACILTGMADKWLSKHDWQDGKQDKASLSDIVKDIREGTLLDDLELLAWALAEKDIEKIERLLTQQKGLDFDKIEEYRDAGILTEHFTVCGNLFCLLKREKIIFDGQKRLIQLAAFLKDGKVGLLSLKPTNTLAEAMTAIDMLLAKNE